MAVAASAPFLAGTMIQGLLVLNYDSYIFERWHGTLLYWAILLFSAAVNIWCSDILPLVENLSLLFHLVSFLIVMVVVCVVSPTKHDASFVFGHNINNSGWSSSGVAWCIGLLSSCYVMIGKQLFSPSTLSQIYSHRVSLGYDGAIHLSEEMHNPEVGVPYAMVGSIVINGIMGFGFLIAILFSMGDLDSALSTATGYPIIQIFYNITGNIHSATALTCTVVVMASLATIPLMASAGRMLWALARDQGEHEYTFRYHSED